MKYLMAALLLILSAGCAKGAESASGVAAPTKALFSSWQSNAGVPLNLTGVQFDTFTPMTINFTSGATCSCNIFVSGTEAAGTLGLSQCTPSGGADPGCGSLGNSGTYTVIGPVLKICAPFCTSYN